MRLIYKENTLKARGISAFNNNWLMIFFKLLYVDNDNFRLPKRIIVRLIVLYLIHQLTAALNRVRNKSTRGKFSYRLLKKINAVNNEEEFSNGVVLSIKICKTFYIIICKCRFSAPLSMPNNTTFNPGRKFLTQGK